MEDNNPSVEELLKSLRKTMEKRANAYNVQENNSNIFQLKKPIKEGDAKEDEQVIGFLNQIIEKVVLRALIENKHLLQNALENIFASEKGSNLFSSACYDYVKSRQDFEIILKEVIEKKISSLLR